ncbi:MAG: aminotransferase class I/II-fold pyridoxal phosphate-dependent enzyme [Candidatus Heimdallarchaeota archaeon]|nr:aminotransferase class I/II-fold pyridoxal phosphate-dependent enzyme [Candidatus Heimdallarchaeota archaeon]MCK4255121.1 aminotransferase class I/II-fold pyridoxal phosphate-dependent enzyme [Candidatus Heimdallarchaeota archaeon]
MTEITEIIDNKRIKALLAREKNLERFNLNTYMLPIEGSTGRTVTVGGEEFIMLGSYSYLGLINHPEIIKVAHETLDKYGSGAGGVRLLTGTTDLHKRLENRIAEFKQTEDSIVYSSGYVTNMTLISTLLGKNDLVIIDKYDHQSIYDGCILSKADWKRFNHNDLTDLDRVLEEHRKNYERVLVIVDGVFSMDGDIAPMPEIVEIAKKHDSFTMVDDAHGLGAIGPNGKGVEDYYDMKPGSIDIMMGTLSKAIPSVGGYVAGNKKMITYLRYTSNAFIFSAALPPVMAAVALKALDIIETEKDRVQALQKNISTFITRVKEMGYNTLKSKDTPIVPVIIGDDIKTFRFAKKMKKEGVLVPPIVYPAVPRESGRLRCCVMATHTEEDMEKILSTIEKVGKSMKVI